MDVALIPGEMPNFRYDPMVTMLTSEAAAAFDELTRSGRDKLLTAQSADDWPNTFRCARFIPAVEYIQASRARRLAMDAVAKVFDTVDVIVAPTSSEQLVITNLTGHPALILPNGFRGDDAPKPPAVDSGDDDNIGGAGKPGCLAIFRNFYRGAGRLAVCRARQESAGFPRGDPKPGFKQPTWKKTEY